MQGRRDGKIELPEDVLESEEKLDTGIPQKPWMMTPDIDPDVLEALENPDEFEEIDDDFVIVANQIIDEDEEDDEDYDEIDEDDFEEISPKLKPFTKPVKGQFDDEDEEEDLDGLDGLEEEDEEDEDYEDYENDENEEEGLDDLDGLEGEDVPKKPTKPKKVPRSQQHLQLKDYMPQEIKTDRDILETRFEKVI